MPAAQNLPVGGARVSRQGRLKGDAQADLGDAVEDQADAANEHDGLGHGERGDEGEDAAKDGKDAKHQPEAPARTLDVTDAEGVEDIPHAGHEDDAAQKDDQVHHGPAGPDHDEDAQHDLDHGKDDVGSPAIGRVMTEIAHNGADAGKDECPPAYVDEEESRGGWSNKEAHAQQGKGYAQNDDGRFGALEKRLIHGYLPWNKAINVFTCAH